MDDEGYVFQKDTDRVVGMLKRRQVHLGKLDETGEFYEDRTQEPLWFPELAFSGARRRKFTPEMRARIPLLNAPTKDEEEVFEFRSQRLIPGALSREGLFVPNVGGKIIYFRDYKFGPTARRIYNLPGSFVQGKTDGRGRN